MYSICRYHWLYWVLFSKWCNFLYRVAVILRVIVSPLILPNWATVVVWLCVCVRSEEDTNTAFLWWESLDKCQLRLDTPTCFRDRTIFFKCWLNFCNWVTVFGLKVLKPHQSMAILKKKQVLCILEKSRFLGSGLFIFYLLLWFGVFLICKKG